MRGPELKALGRMLEAGGLRAHPRVGAAAPGCNVPQPEPVRQ